jgi:hypothetical protein
LYNKPQEYRHRDKLINANRSISNQLAFKVVDYTGKISNLLEDLEKLDGFAESIEGELLNLIIEKAES